MVVYVLILSFLFEGEVQFAIYNGGTKDAYEFKTREACEKVRDEQLANMDKILTPDAKLIDLRCVGRNGGA